MFFYTKLIKLLSKDHHLTMMIQWSTTSSPPTRKQSRLHTQQAASPVHQLQTNLLQTSIVGETTYDIVVQLMLMANNANKSIKLSF